MQHLNVLELSTVNLNKRLVVFVSSTNAEVLEYFFFF